MLKAWTARELQVFMQVLGGRICHQCVLNDRFIQNNQFLEGKLTLDTATLKYSIEDTQVFLCPNYDAFPILSLDDNPLCFVTDVQELKKSGYKVEFIKKSPIGTLGRSSGPAGYFTCNRNDSTLCPFKDCLNLVALYCQTTSPVFVGWKDCQSKVETVRNQLNSNWKRWVNSCALWLGGNPSSSACKDATARMLNNEIYYYYGTTGAVLVERIN